MTRLYNTSAEDNPLTIVNSSLPYNVYLYWMDSYIGGMDSGVISMDCLPLSHASTLISAQYSPYLNYEDFRITKIPYDKERYGYTPETPVNVYRIEGYQSGNGTINKLLGTFKCYAPTKTIGGNRSYKNESKLYNYPYRYAFLYDGIGDPIEVRFEDCASNTNEVYARLALNINADYSLYIKNYRKDTNGEMEQNVVNAATEYPCLSNQYASWLATSKNQMQASKNNNMMSAFMSSMTSIGTGLIAGGGVGAVAGGGVGAIPGALIGGTLGAVNSFSNLQNQDRSMKAQEKDNRNLPPTLISKGGDITLGMNTTGQKLKLYIYTQKEEYLNKFGTFFALYGYKQNKIMTVNTRNRQNYNFIKTVGANISIADNVPIFVTDIIKNILDNGTTIWHVDRNGGIITDYSKDNNEV